MTIHDPDVVVTDLGLAILGGYLAWRLSQRRPAQFLTRAGVVLMTGLASAAFWGALFHAFFPANTRTVAGFLAWVPVSLSIVVVATVLLAVGLRVLIPQLSIRVRRTLSGVYALIFAGTVLFIDESYGTIVRFYAPTLLLFLIAAVREATRTRSNAWWVLAAALAISIVAAGLQQLQVSLHAIYFDHNALYHVLQGIALVLLYRGFGGVATTHANGPDPASRRE